MNSTALFGLISFSGGCQHHCHFENARVTSKSKCACVHLCFICRGMYVCLSVWVCMCVEARGQLWVQILRRLLPCFSDTLYHWYLELTKGVRLAWQWAPGNLCLPSSMGITSVHHDCLFCVSSEAQLWTLMLVSHWSGLSLKTQLIFSM